MLYCRSTMRFTSRSTWRFSQSTNRKVRRLYFGLVFSMPNFGLNPRCCTLACGPQCRTLAYNLQCRHFRPEGVAAHEFCDCRRHHSRWKRQLAHVAGTRAPRWRHRKAQLVELLHGGVGLGKRHAGHRHCAGPRQRPRLGWIRPRGVPRDWWIWQSIRRWAPPGRADQCGDILFDSRLLLWRASSRSAAPWTASRSRSTSWPSRRATTTCGRAPSSAVTRAPCACGCATSTTRFRSSNSACTARTRSR